MKSSNTSRTQISQLQPARPEARSVKDSTPSKTRNFGWLVKGMVEACHQISADDLV